MLTAVKDVLNKTEPASTSFGIANLWSDEVHEAEERPATHSNDPTIDSCPSGSGPRYKMVLVRMGMKGSGCIDTVKSGRWSSAFSGGLSVVRVLVPLGGRNVYVIGSWGIGTAE
jgi:hypothetical protein